VADLTGEVVAELGDGVLVWSCEALSMAGCGFGHGGCCLWFAMADEKGEEVFEQRLNAGRGLRHTAMGWRSRWRATHNTESEKKVKREKRNTQSTHTKHTHVHTCTETEINTHIFREGKRIS